METNSTKVFFPLEIDTRAAACKPTPDPCISMGCMVSLRWMAVEQIVFWSTLSGSRSSGRDWTWHDVTCLVTGLGTGVTLWSVAVRSCAGAPSHSEALRAVKRELAPLATTSAPAIHPIDHWPASTKDWIPDLLLESGGRGERGNVKLFISFELAFTRGKDVTIDLLLS